VQSYPLSFGPNQIGLPDKHGRLQILRIHTAKMRDNKLMDSDVNMDELADKTKNYSGAEIEALVKSAASYAFDRYHSLHRKTLTDMNGIRGKLMHPTPPSLRIPRKCA